MASADVYLEAEKKYRALRAQFDAGEISPEYLTAEVHRLMITDDAGNAWNLALDTGRWNVFRDGAWSEANPYMEHQAPAAAAPEPEPGPVGQPQLEPVADPVPSPEPEPAAPAAPPAYTPPPPPAYTPPPPAYTPPPPAPYTPPPPAPVAVAGPAPARKRGRGRGCLFGCLGVVALVIVVAVGLFIAIRTNTITQGDILNVAGLGPATVEVDNLRDDAVSVSIEPIGGSSGSTTTAPSPGGGGISFSGESLALNPYDIKIKRLDNPGKYRVMFQSSKDGKALGTCVLNVRGGDTMQFVTLANNITINRVNNPLSSGSDLVITTSSLCKN
ncbi:MAG: hypothetical protein QOE92_1181 [Chloroflexota bacterium]|jgi:outer membrane biosynthesis protein TonB|nr:hypothetical protein [Chloroflexota bacterium]